MKTLIAILTVLVSVQGGHYLVLLFLRLIKIKIQDEFNTGKWLGFLERALVSLFVCLGLIPQTIFIFAVKAAVLGYRLPDNNTNERKTMVEYMLLGTMISYFVALSIGLIGLKIIKIFE